MVKRKKKDIFQRYPQVWQNFSKFLYELAKYSYIGLVIGGLVTKEILLEKVRWGILFGVVFVGGGFLFDFLSQERRRR